MEKKKGEYDRLLLRESYLFLNVDEKDQGKGKSRRWSALRPALLSDPAEPLESELSESRVPLGEEGL